MAHGTREDWQAGKSVIECNKYMFLNQLYCDVTFRVGEEEAVKEIKAHKYVLASRSNVFEAMLFGSLSETVIRIPDIESGIFIAMLRSE